MLQCGVYVVNAFLTEKSCPALFQACMNKYMNKGCTSLVDGLWYENSEVVQEGYVPVLHFINK